MGRAPLLLACTLLLTAAAAQDTPTNTVPSNAVPAQQGQSQSQSGNVQEVQTRSNLGAGLGTPVQPASERATELLLQGRVLMARGMSGGGTSGVLWERHFAAELGRLVGPLVQGGYIYLGVGPVVLALDEAGVQRARYDLSAPVLALDASSGAVQATVTGVALGSADGAPQPYRETFTLQAPRVATETPVTPDTPAEPATTGSTQERVVFPPDPAVTLWPMHFADSVPDSDVAREWARTPLNPFLGLRAARQARAASNEAAEAEALAALMAAPQPFPVWVKLAARLDAAGYPAQAEAALEQARIDAAARGYDPTIRVSRAALAAYGDPAAYIASLLEQGRVGRTEVWLRHLRELHPRSAGARALYLQHAQLLENAGRAGEASEWRRFAAELRGDTLYGLGADATDTLAEAARLWVLALALTLALAYFAIRARVAPAQASALDAWGGRWRAWGPHPVQRLRFASLRLAGAGERLALLGLALGLVGALGGLVWAQAAGERLESGALNVGTYGGAWAESSLAQLPLRAVPDATLVRTLGLQLSGDLGAARRAYQAGRELPCIQNNLGAIAAIRGDQIGADSAYRRALEGTPSQMAAAYNLGFPVAALGAEFQRRYHAGEPRLCFPDDRSLLRALGGDARTVWKAQLENPAATLRAATTPLASGRITPLAALLVAQALLLALSVVALLPTPLRMPAPAPKLGPLAWLLPGAALLPWVWGAVPMVLFASGVVGLAGSVSAEYASAEHMALKKSAATEAGASLLPLLPEGWRWSGELQAALLPWLPLAWPAWAAPALALALAYALNSAALTSLALLMRRDKQA